MIKLKDITIRGAAVTALAMLLTFTYPLLIRAEEAFETQNYQVEITVNEKQSYEVTEKIDVNFPKEKHGIYRYIPYVGTLHTVVDGADAREEYLAKISKIKVEKDPCDISTESGNKIIQIGDKDIVISGAHTYDISYQYSMKNDKDNGQDVFYYNVIPSRWESTIEKASVTIHMPKEFDASGVDVFAGAYGSKEEGLVEYEITGNDINIYSVAELAKETGVTVRVLLPEEYFQGVPSTKGWLYAALALALLCSVIFVYLWIHYGRARRFVRTVEFYPPEEISPAEIGYVVDGVVDRRDMLSLIIYFASRGYLTIQKNKDGETYLIKGEKSEDQMPEYQKTFFTGLFQHAENKRMENKKTENKKVENKKEEKKKQPEVKNREERVALSRISDGFYDLYERSVDELVSGYAGEKRLYEQSGLKGIISFLLVTLVVGGGLFLSLASGEWDGIFLYLVPLILYVTADAVSRKFTVGRYVEAEGKKLLHSVSIIAIVTIAVIVEAAVIWLTLSEYKQPVLLYTIASVLGFFVLCHSDRRTEYGAAILGKSLGFRDFIQKAEKNRINQLVEENPQYFYDVLPYAYAMNVTDKWAKQFEKIRISPPVWYDGMEWDTYNELGMGYAITSELEQISHSISDQIDFDAPTDSGFDSDSDGGFSGGGAGGGGGDAW